MNQLYMENILDHYKNPRNHGELKEYDMKHIEYNPLCGDKIEIQLKLNNGFLHDIRFKGIGCSISQAATSMLTEHIKGKKIEDIKKLTKEDIFEMIGITLSPVRIKCALLGFDTIKNALLINEKYQGEYQGEYQGKND